MPVIFFILFRQVNRIRLVNILYMPKLTRKRKKPSLLRYTRFLQKNFTLRFYLVRARFHFFAYKYLFGYIVISEYITYARTCHAKLMLMLMAGLKIQYYDGI